MSNTICELDVICPHCNGPNKITYVADIEDCRIDCSHCRRTIGFKLNHTSAGDAEIVLQDDKVA